MFTDPNRSKPPVWRIILYTVIILAFFVAAGYFRARVG
jgi:hypothetical protein